MDDVAPSTGPAADRAFRIGLLVVTVATFAVVGGLVTADIVSPVAAIGGLLLGYPIILFGAAIVLGVWLGYADEAQYRGAKYALENNNLDNQND